MSLSSPALDKYLDRYAEPQVHAIQGLAAVLKTQSNNIDSVLVVPCFDEPIIGLKNICDYCAQHHCLLILVLNQPESCLQETNNSVGAEYIAQINSTAGKKTPALWSSPDGVMTLVANKQGRILTIDCFTANRRLNDKMGVGLARKIGADIACALIEQGAINQPWIYCSDADVDLPKAYFDASKQATKNTAALVLPFKHHCSNQATLLKPQALYDLHMNYYVAGLRWARSPYAYHSLGSTQVIHAIHYAKVRGFPKKNAGEDFYLLNKLCKTGAIMPLSTPCILITARLSQRTPFGTGHAVQKIIDLNKPISDYRFYNPDIFLALRVFLAGFEQFWAPDAQHSTLAFKRYSWLALEPNLSDAATDVLYDMKFDEAIAKARQNSRDAAAFGKHLHAWFDGFRTLKFIHGMRDKGRPSVPLACLKNATNSYPFIDEVLTLYDSTVGKSALENSTAK